MLKDVTVTARVRLAHSRLQIELVDDSVLHVRSLVDRAQVLVLPLPPAPGIDGVARASRLSRLHALTWGLVYGSTTLPTRATVIFSTSSIRFRSTVTAQMTQLGDHVWVADAEGDFSTAALVVDGVETARTVLATR